VFKGEMAAIPTEIGAKTSSLFAIPAHRDLQPHGSSVTSYAWEPHEDGTRKAKKVYICMRT